MEERESPPPSPSPDHDEASSPPPSPSGPLSTPSAGAGAVDTRYLLGTAALVLWTLLVLYEYRTRHKHVVLFDGFGDGVLASLLVAIVLATAATSLGLALVHRALPFAQVEARLLAGFGLGSGALGWAAFSLAWAGWLFAPPVALVVLGALAAGARLLVADVRELWRRRPARTPAPVYPLLLLALLLLLASLAPPHEWDELAYHLPIPVHAAATGRAPLAGHDFSYYPQLCESLTAMGMVMSATVRVGRVLNLVFGVALACAVFVAARDLTRAAPRAAWLALAIVCVEPVIIVTAPVAGVDLALSFYAVLAVYLLARELPAGSKGWVLGAVVGLLAGFACGTSYRGVLAAFAIGASLVAAGRGRALGAFALAAALGAAPWYLRNFAATGDPMYPFLHSLFPTRPLPTGFTALGWPQPDLHPHVAAKEPTDLAFKVVQILRLPWDITILGRSHTHGRFDADFSPIYLAMVPVLAMVRWRTLKRPFYVWAAYALVHSALWAVSPSSHGTRYQMSVAAVAAITIPAAIAAVGSRMARVGASRVAAALCVLLYFGALNAFNSRADAWNVIGGGSTRDYLRALGDGALFEFTWALNREPETPGPVLMIGEKRTLYFERPVIADFDLDNVGALYRNGGGTPEGMAALLRKSGIRDIVEHSLMAKDGMAPEEQKAYAEMVARFTTPKVQASYLVWRQLKD